MMHSVADFLLRILYDPKKVIFICGATLLVSLILNGKVFQLVGLYAQKDRLAVDIEQISSQTSNLKMQIKEAKHLKFIEKKARDQLDLVEEGDLIFVFSEEPVAAAKQ